jgi:hypothetical protein
MNKFVFALLGLLVILFFTSGCTQTCYEQTEAYRPAIDDIIEAWDNTRVVANSTARRSLAEPVDDLQGILRRVEAMEDDGAVPECALAAHHDLESYMEATVNVFLAVMSDENDQAIAGKMSSAKTLQDIWTSAYARLDDRE